MIAELAEYQFKTEIPLRWKDIDQFGHVNNANYLTFFEVARYFYCKEMCDWDWAVDQFIIASIKIDYLRPVFFPDPTFCYLRIRNIGTKSFDFEYIVTSVKNGVEKITTKGSSTQVMYDLASHQTISVPERLIEKINHFEKL
jgi:acyl-CoA thioester hydrolase